MVDDFDADMLTHRNKAISVDVDTYAGVTTAPATASTAIEGVKVAVRDQTQSGDPQHTEMITALTVDDPASGDNFTFTAFRGCALHL